MANMPNQKLKLLHVLKVLMDKTDDVNGVTTQQIIEELAYHGIDAERKGIYRDMDALREFGYAIEQRGGKYWYLASRPMDLQEMILLVDAVQSTPVLTEEMTDRLIERIQSFASDDQKKMLEKRIEVPGRVKMDNAAILRNIDVIQQAMRRKRKVEFKYFHYDIKKERALKRDGGAYRVTPVRLIYADEFYYLIAFADEWAGAEGHQPFTPYRVDRMVGVAVSDEPATKDARIATYVTDEHISPSFGVFAAEKVPVVLEFDQVVMNAIIDKFGLDALVFEMSDDRAKAYVKAPLSPPFYGWLLTLVPYVKIASPTRAMGEFNRMLTQAHRMYRGQYRIRSERSREALSQEQFLQLVEALEAALRDRVATLQNGGFETEAAFADFAFETIEAWMAGQGVDDGMPRKAPEERMIRGKMHRLPSLINSTAYEAYGQAVGEAMLAVDPRKWAAPGARDSFTDTAKRYKGRPFRFERLTDWTTREPAGDEHGGKRSRVEHGGATFEVWHERGENPSRCRFTDGKANTEPMDLEPWLGGERISDARKAAERYWQKIAYRFS